MRTLTLLLATALALSLPFPAAYADEGEDARRTLLLRVQYVGSDYRRAVPEAGRVASEPEFSENLAFAREAAAGYRRNRPEGPLAAELDRLATSVGAQASPSDVEALAASLVPRLRRELDLAPSPMFFPDLGAGRLAYARRCACCHGETGRGDGPQGRELDPPPRDFTAPAWADGQSPLQVFNTMTVGIPGTAMTGVGNTEGASTRWAIAFAVLTLRPTVTPVPASRPWIGVTELAGRSNRELAAALVRSGVAEDAAAALADAARRAEPPALTIAEAMERLRDAGRTAIAAAAAGNRAEAGDVLDAAYFDAVEPVEPELVQRAPSHLEPLETAVASLREALRRSPDAGPALAALEAELDTIALLDLGRLP